MRMKKLSVCALLLTVLLCLLAACQIPSAGGNTSTSERTADATESAPATSEEPTGTLVTKVRVVYSASATEPEKAAAKRLRTALEACTETELVTDTRSGLAEVYEIAVGDTNRPQSASALEGVTGTRYVSEVGPSGAVLQASNDTCLDSAVTFLLTRYGTDAGLRVPQATERTVSEPLPALALVRNGVMRYRLLYDRSLTSSVMTGAVRTLATSMSDATGLRVGTESAGTNLPPEPLLLVGSAGDSEVTKAFYNSLAPNEYGIVADGDRICLLGKTDHSLRLCMEQFGRLFRYSLEQNADGGWDVSLLYDAPLRYTYNAYAADYPLYTDGALAWVDCANDTLECIASGTTEAAYATYIGRLMDAGYAVNQSEQVGSNRFATLTDGKTVLVVNYLAADSSVRIFSTPKNQAVLPTENPVLGNGQVTDSTLTVLALDYQAQWDNGWVKVGNNGLSFVFTLTDGSYLIYDGGHAVDAGTLYDFLSANNHRRDGKIVIAAWVLTHSHSDHYGCFKQFASDYGREVLLESVIVSPVSMYRWLDSADDAYLAEGMESDIRRFSGTRRIVMPHMGQRLAVGNATVEILLTSEDVSPYRLEYGNEGCMVTRVTLDGSSVLMMGDCENSPSSKLMDFWGENLYSDILQVPHHGNSGGSEKLYRLVNPTVAIFPTSAVSYEKYTAKGWKDGSGHLLVNGIAKRSYHAGETFTLIMKNLTERQK